MKVNNENNRIRISQRHGSADPDPPQNVMDPQHCLKHIVAFLPVFFKTISCSLYSSPDLVDILRTDFSMTYTGTLKANRKGLPDIFKSMAGRADGDYFVLYDITGKKSIHSWINQKKSGESLFLHYQDLDPE